MDRLTALSVFVAAAELGSLAAAARRLGMTPAMAGKYLAALEASLGIRLMQRTTRKLHLTEAGEGYLPRCRDILDALDEADRAASALQAEPRGLLRITAPASFAAPYLAPPVAAFLDRHPAMRIEMTVQDRFADMIGEGFDLAIRIGHLADSSLIARRFAESRMMACAAPSYLAARGDPETPEDLARLDRLAFSRAQSAGDWSFTGADGQAHRVAGTPRLLADDMDMLVAAAVAGAGVVYGPSFALAPHLASGALARVLPGFRTETLGIHCLYPSARLAGAKLRLFIDALERWFASIPAWEAAP
ncbi:LysR family transcriptional regulator [Acidisoma sp. C75]